jgi:adenylylsulfate kinase
MASTYQRSLMKGVLWELISFFIASFAVYLVYGNIGTSILFSLVLTLIKVPLFFIHERMWKKVKWGKIKDGKKR